MHLICCDGFSGDDSNRCTVTACTADAVESLNRAWNRGPVSRVDGGGGGGHGSIPPPPTGGPSTYTAGVMIENAKDEDRGERKSPSKPPEPVSPASDMLIAEEQAQVLVTGGDAVANAADVAADTAVRINEPAAASLHAVDNTTISDNTITSAVAAHQVVGSDVVGADAHERSPSPMPEGPAAVQQPGFTIPMPTLRLTRARSLTPAGATATSVDIVQDTAVEAVDNNTATVVSEEQNIAEDVRLSTATPARSPSPGYTRVASPAPAPEPFESVSTAHVLGLNFNRYLCM